VSIMEQETTVPASDYVWENIIGPSGFRLLDLHGYNGKAQITCSLTSTDMNSNPKYTAISYFWGAPKLTHTILCDGAALPVTANVHALLNQLLQRDDLNKKIWIDAICIDQNNLNEREQQVRLMKDIFSKASTTLVWLGTPDEPATVSPMLELGDKIIEMTKRVSPRRLKSEDLEACGLPPIDDRSWSTLANFFCLPWFHRVWVTQEYVLAKEVTFLYGRHWKSSDFYVTIIRTFVFNEDSYYLEELLRPLVLRPKQTNFWLNTNTDRWLGISSRLSQMEYFRSIRKLKADYQKWPLRMLLTRSSTSQTTDPRDHIYGVLGILPEDARSHPDLQPNYHPSHEVQITYVKLARFVLETRGLATLLSSTGFPRLTLTKPSWVPDWSQQKLPSTVHRQAMLTVPSKYGRDGYAPWRLDGGSVPQKLIVRGIFFDTIEEIESMIARIETQSATPYHEACISFINDTRALMLKSAHIDELPQALGLRHLKTLCLADPPGLVFDAGYIRTVDLEETAKLVAPIYDFINLKVLLNNPDLLQQIGQHIRRVYVSDTSLGFSLTKNGEIGRVPHEAKVNDKVCFFQGINIPFVIRESEEAVGEYTLIDHCYIDGQMDGKFWEKHCHQEALEICLV